MHCRAESSTCGERAHRDSEPCAADPPGSPLDHILNAGDWEYDFDPDHNHQHNMNAMQSKFNNLVSQFTAELNEVSTWDSLRHQPRLQVLEVFCSSESELTRQVNQLGYRASRHGIQEGDLNSKGGRQQLFKTLPRIKTSTCLVQPHLRTMVCLELSKRIPKYCRFSARSGAT